MNSTTAQSSVPCSGFLPARHSSPVNMPVTWPWWRSRNSIIAVENALSSGRWSRRQLIADAFAAMPVFTTCLVHFQRPRRGVGAARSSVANSARKSTPCARSFFARSSSHGSRVRS